MSLDEFVKVTEALTKLVGVLIWPVLFAVVLVMFGPSLKEFFSSLGEFSLKGGGIEATAKRKQEATAALVAATVARRPNNNIYERQALSALGISFVLAASTEEAIELLAKHKFDVIISDMGRPSDSRAGYTLLDKLRSSGDRTPFVIYAGSSAPEHKAEARAHGAIGSTNRAPELFEYVLAAINRGG